MNRVPFPVKGLFGGLLAAVIIATAASTAFANPITTAIREAARGRDACPQLRCYSCAFWTAHDIETTLSGFGDQWYAMSCADADCPNPCQQLTTDNDESGTDVADAAREVRPTEDQIDEIWSDLGGNDIRSARDFLRAHRFASVNQERRSMQLTGCGGSVIANIPLTQTQLTALSE